VLISRVKLKNWRNFRDVDVPLVEVSYLIGANATGKSNFLDAFRFLRDLVKAQGGGLQGALAERRGLSKVRCLHARKDAEVCLEVHLAEHASATRPTWIYRLGFKSEGGGLNRSIISVEEVDRFDGDAVHRLLQRPDADDLSDKERLTRTSLEHPQTNAAFRAIAEHLSQITYLHLVPQLLRFGDEIGGRRLENDPFGQGFLERVARVSEKVRNSRLSRIKEALSGTVPQFQDLRFDRDEVTGRPHLEAKYKHHRPLAGWQREDLFSDGTLRLIALFWPLLEGDDLLLLEEPELSLNEEIVRRLPELIDRVRRPAKRRGRQVIITTHSQALLENKAIDGRGVLRFERDNEGSRIAPPTEMMEQGFSAAEILLPRTHRDISTDLELA
jgi:predicted ATPase